MTHAIPADVLDVFKKVQENGYDVFFVGGSVRNMLMERKVKDWDLTTSATPEQILQLFPNGFYDNQFGTVGIPLEQNNSDKLVVEITTFRTENKYSDKRRPDKVEWGETIEQDLERRDFTINAIALRLTSFAQGKHPQFELIDPFEGQKDIESKLIKAVGDPQKRFKEDALRLLRAVRLATELKFTIDKTTWDEMKKDAHLIEHVSGERIRIELLRILSSDQPYEGILLLKEAHLMEHILPEILKGEGVSQVRPGRHHTADVFTHNIESLKHTSSKNPIVRFATLLHDVGKPWVKGEDREGLVIFHNHEIKGAQIAKDICDRLKFSKKDRDKVVTLIRWHMFSVEEHVTDAGIRRFIRRIGVDNVKDMIDLRIGDRLGSGTQTAESWRLKLFKERIEEQLQPAPFGINDLVINGNDIMKELNIKPGPKVGEILQKLFEEVDEDLSKNTKEYLLKRIHEINSR